MSFSCWGVAHSVIQTLTETFPLHSLTHSPLPRAALGPELQIRHQPCPQGIHGLMRGEHTEGKALNTYLIAVCQRPKLPGLSRSSHSRPRSGSELVTPPNCLPTAQAQLHHGVTGSPSPPTRLGTRLTLSSAYVQHPVQDLHIVGAQRMLVISFSIRG